MIGKLNLVNTLTNKVFNIYDYSNIDLELKKELKQKLKENPNYKLICGCRSDCELELKISEDYKLYKAHQDTAKLHAEKCPKSIEYEHWNKLHNSGWKKDENSEEILATLDFSLNPGNSKNKDTDSTNKLSLNLIAKLVKIISFFLSLKFLYLGCLGQPKYFVGFFL